MSRDAGQPGARTFPQPLCLRAGAHNFQLAWHCLTFLGKFSSLCHRALCCSRKEKKKNKDPWFYSRPREEAVSLSSAVPCCGTLTWWDGRRKGRTADGIQCRIADSSWRENDLLSKKGCNDYRTWSTQRKVDTSGDSGMEEEKEAVTRTRNAVGLDKAFSYRSREKRRRVTAMLEETESSGDRGRNSHRTGWLAVPTDRWCLGPRCSTNSSQGKVCPKDRLLLQGG